LWLRRIKARVLLRFTFLEKEDEAWQGSSLGVGIMPREIITFQCTECKNRNYSSTKNKKTTTERLELKKFCPQCRKHQVHREIK